MKASELTGTTIKEASPEDQKLWDILKGDAPLEEIEEHVYLEDMGQIDDEERTFLIVDKDTGEVFDLRNDQQIERLTSRTTTRLDQSVTGSKDQ